MIVRDRGRPARKRAAGALIFRSIPNPFSRCALIAGGTPAVPDNHLLLFRGVKVRVSLGVDATRVFLNHPITIELRKQGGD